MPDFHTVEELAEYHGVPFKLRKDQIDAVEYLYSFQVSGLFADAGVGKTATSTVLSLAWDTPCAIVLCPPILARGWHNWLNKLKHVGKIVKYRGTPAQRKQVDLAAYRWVIMTPQIFKRDFASIKEQLAHLKPDLLIDEATCIKNSSSDNFKSVQSWITTVGSRAVAITATPTTGPDDAFAYIKLKTPSIYRSHSHFRSVHVAEYDFFGAPSEWSGLDQIKSRLHMQAVRVLKTDVLTLDAPNFIVQEYELEPKHAKLYKKLIEEMLLELPDSSVVTYEQGSRLYNASQQIIANLPDFSGDASDVSSIFQYLETLVTELDVTNLSKSKLFVVSYFKRTSRRLLEWFKAKGIDAVAAYSEVSGKQQEINADRFENDPNCRVFIGQPLSAGYGLNFQHVCNEMVYVEFPIVPMHFHQTYERIWRDGQTKPCNIRIACAADTVQIKLFQRLLNKDDMSSYLQANKSTLRRDMFGE